MAWCRIDRWGAGVGIRGAPWVSYSCCRTTGLAVLWLGQNGFCLCSCQLIWSVYMEGKSMCMCVWKCPSHVLEYVIEQFLPLSTNALENGVNVSQWAHTEPRNGGDSFSVTSLIIQATVIGSSMQSPPLFLVLLLLCLVFIFSLCFQIVSVALLVHCCCRYQQHI